jgi:hypothetical protein
MSQLLVTVGLLLVVGAALVAGSAALVRSTSVVTNAAPDLLEVPAVRDAVRAEFTVAIQTAYGDEVVPAASLEMASERMARNGAVVDAFVESLNLAHLAWLYGGDLAVDLDDRVATQAAMTGLRDADLALARAPSTLPAGPPRPGGVSLGGLGPRRSRRQRAPPSWPCSSVWSCSWWVRPCPLGQDVR